MLALSIPWKHVKSHPFTELQSTVGAINFFVLGSQREAIFMPTGTLTLDTALKA